MPPDPRPTDIEPHELLLIAIERAIEHARLGPSSAGTEPQRRPHPAHGLLRLVMQREGRARLGDDTPLLPGDLLVSHGLPAPREPDLAPDGPGRTLVAELELAAPGLRALSTALPRRVHLAARTLTPPVRAHLDALDAHALTERSPPWRTLARIVVLVLAELMHATHAGHAPQDGEPPGVLVDLRVARALHAMRARLAHPWTVAELARIAAMSRAQFARAFREIVGDSPLAHLRTLRLQAATTLIGTGAGLAAIAEQIGYSSESALSRAFKNHRGTRPSLHRGTTPAHAASPRDPSCASRTTGQEDEPRGHVHPSRSRPS